MSLGTEQFAQHYSEHIDEIYRYVFFAVRQHGPTAEDITSDIFMKAWKHAKRFDSEKASFRTFIFRIARTTVIDHWRTHKEVQEMNTEVMQKRDVKQQPGEQVDAQLFWQKAYTQLAEDAFEVMVLKYRNELSVEEIAEITERTEDSVKGLIKRSRATLKTVLTQ